MVAAHGRDVGGARLFPSRDDERRALLALPSRRWGREHNGRSELVHPWRVRMTDRSAIPTTTYVELQVTSHFSFLRGASAPEELFAAAALLRSEEHTSELPSLMRISYAVFCLKTK